MDFLVPLLTVVVVLGVSLVIRALRQRAGRQVPAIPWKQIIAYIALTAVGLVAATLADSGGENAALRDLLLAFPLILYVAYAVHWLVRHRREIVEGWKSESAEDRKRGLTGNKR